MGDEGDQIDEIWREGARGGGTVGGASHCGGTAGGLHGLDGAPSVTLRRPHRGDRRGQRGGGTSGTAVTWVGATRHPPQAKKSAR